MQLNLFLSIAILATVLLTSCSGTGGTVFSCEVWETWTSKTGEEYLRGEYCEVLVPLPGPEDDATTL